MSRKQGSRRGETVSREKVVCFHGGEMEEDHSGEREGRLKRKKVSLSCKKGVSQAQRGFNKENGRSPSGKGRAQPSARDEVKEENTFPYSSSLSALKGEEKWFHHHAEEKTHVERKTKATPTVV